MATITLTVDEFVRNIGKYSETEDYIRVTKRGKYVFLITPSKWAPENESQVSEGKNEVSEGKVEMNPGIDELPLQNATLPRCQKCKLECNHEEIKEHWEDGESYQVCIFCKNPKKMRTPLSAKKTKVDLPKVKMNDKMKELLGL